MNPLISAVFSKAKANGHNQRDLAAKLGIGLKFINSLNSKKPPAISIKNARAMAEYLCIPTAEALQMAELFKKEDFELNLSSDVRVDALYQNFRLDPMLCGFAPNPAAWALLDPSAKLLIAMLFENVDKSKIDMQMMNCQNTANQMYNFCAQ